MKHIVITSVCLIFVLLRQVHAATNIFSAVHNGSFSAYTINGVDDPPLRLVRGFTYTINVSAGGHPFWIKTLSSTGSGNAYTNGISGNGTQSGTLTFTVPTNAPSQLFFNCQIHPGMAGVINIEDPPTVQVVSLDISTNVVLRSTGSDALNLRVVTSTNLSSTNWVMLASPSNTYSQGTNVTTLPAATNAALFYRVEQGF